MKIGVSIKVDVSKIDKARLYKGEKGTYLSLTTFIDTDNADQYDNNGFISQDTSKEERAQGVQTPILGNVKVFYKEDSAPPVSQPNNVADFQAPDEKPKDFDDDIPFS